MTKALSTLLKFLFLLVTLYNIKCFLLFSSFIFLFRNIIFNITYLWHFKEFNFHKLQLWATHVFTTQAFIVFLPLTKNPLHALMHELQNSLTSLPLFDTYFFNYLEFKKFLTCYEPRYTFYIVMCEKKWSKNKGKQNKIKA